MIESIEGKRGEPRMRPPYIAEVGLFGRPTLEHNFETLYWVRDIVEKGPQWFSSFGRNGRKGLGQAAPNPIRSIHKYFPHEVGEAPWSGPLPRPVEPVLTEQPAGEKP